METEKEQLGISESTASLVEQIANNMLSPINAKVTIEREPRIFDSWSQTWGHDRREWKEYWYRIHVSSDKGECNLFEQLGNNMLPNQAWMIAYQAFGHIDGDLHSPLANSLWPKENDFKPDYSRFLPKQ